MCNRFTHMIDVDLAKLHHVLEVGGELEANHICTILTIQTTTTDDLYTEERAMVLDDFAGRGRVKVSSRSMGW
jgi:hypothetical protein